MDAGERMMIMGLCLQGLLANPRTDTLDVDGTVKLAHHYAAKLAPEGGIAQATQALELARIVYEGLRAANLQNAAAWPSLDDAVASGNDEYLQETLATVSTLINGGVNEWQLRQDMGEVLVPRDAFTYRVVRAALG